MPQRNRTNGLSIVVPFLVCTCFGSMFVSLTYMRLSQYAPSHTMQEQLYDIISGSLALIPFYGPLLPLWIFRRHLRPVWANLCLIPSLLVAWYLDFGLVRNPLDSTDALSSVIFIIYPPFYAAITTGLAFILLVGAVLITKVIRRREQRA